MFAGTTLDNSHSYIHRLCDIKTATANEWHSASTVWVMDSLLTAILASGDKFTGDKFTAQQYEGIFCPRYITYHLLHRSNDASRFHIAHYSGLGSYLSSLLSPEVLTLVAHVASFSKHNQVSGSLGLTLESTRVSWWLVIWGRM